jgi:integrase
MPENPSKTSLPAVLDPAQGPSGRLPGHLDALAETARDYARGAKAPATQRAYAADWRHYAGWCERKGLDPLPPDPQVIGLYLAACVSGQAGSGKAGSVASSVRTVERRLSAITWHCAQRGAPLDRADRHIAEVMKGIRRQHGKPPNQKEAVLAEDLLRMIGTLGHNLRGLRDRAILLVGFAGGLRRSEITGLDLGPDQTADGAGWIEILDHPTREGGALIHVRGKTGWREVEIGRGSNDRSCPVVALEAWLKFASIVHGPLFRHVAKGGKTVGPDRLTNRHVARRVKRTAMAAGIHSSSKGSEAERRRRFSGHSLRAGLASSAEIDERYVQKQLGHTRAEMTRRYQRRRDRFRVNLTKAAGL